MEDDTNPILDYIETLDFNVNPNRQAKEPIGVEEYWEEQLFCRISKLPERIYSQESPRNTGMEAITTIIYPEWKNPDFKVHELKPWFDYEDWKETMAILSSMNSGFAQNELIHGPITNSKKISMFSNEIAINLLPINDMAPQLVIYSIQNRPSHPENRIIDAHHHFVTFGSKLLQIVTREVFWIAVDHNSKPILATNYLQIVPNRQFNFLLSNKSFRDNKLAEMKTWTMYHNAIGALESSIDTARRP